MEQIFVGIGGDAQFGKEDDHRMSLVCLTGQAERLLRIENGIGHPEGWNTDRHPGESVRVKRFKPPLSAHDLSGRAYTLFGVKATKLRPVCRDGHP